MKALKKIWNNVKEVFVGYAVLLDESKRQNLDGSWDKYHARKNRKAMKRGGADGMV